MFGKQVGPRATILTNTSAAGQESCYRAVLLREKSASGNIKYH